VGGVLILHSGSVGVMDDALRDQRIKDLTKRVDNYQNR
jgi:hypothetical protein